MGSVKSVRLDFPALLAVGIALSATPALSQGAMGPGAGAPMAPQPRAAPAAPQAPVMAPQLPLVTPGTAPAPGISVGGVPNNNKDAAGIKDRPLEHQEPSTTRLGGTTSPTGAPAGIKGSTAIVAILALQANNNSSSIFDRWGNLFVEQPGNKAAPNLSIVSTDRTRGSVAQATTDQKGLFKVPSTPGVHEVTLPAKDIEAAYRQVANPGTGSPQPQAIHGDAWLVVIIAFKVPGAANGGGRQDFGLARAIPQGSPAMQVKLNVNNDGTVSTVDWNDGAGPQPVNREGKALGASSGPGEIVGRTLFVGEAPKKQ